MNGLLAMIPAVGFGVLVKEVPELHGPGVSSLVVWMAAASFLQVRSLRRSFAKLKCQQKGSDCEI